MIYTKLEDNMDYMARFSNNYFDLAIVDPPYKLLGAKFVSKDKQFTGNHGTVDGLSKNKIDLGDRPKQYYFDELFRVSKNQIIWGMQYFCGMLPPTQACVVWDKKQLNTKYSEFELAWTSFETKTRFFSFSNKHRGVKKIHPTQKPVELYKFLLHNYANEGDKILDTHLGSGTIAIACIDYGFDLYGCDKNPKYYNDMSIKIEEHKKQGNLFVNNY